MKWIEVSTGDRKFRLAGAVFAAMILTASASAQAPGEAPGEKAAAPESAEALAKKLSNPIADLVSLPLQFNWQEGYGVNDDLQFVMNFQPVVPFHISKDWNMIGRFIVPYISQPEIQPGVGPVSGLGTITFSTFFSPAGSTGFTWGIGPVFGLPMTSDPLLGGGQWLMGPTAVGLYQTGPWTMGALVNQQFSVANTGQPGPPLLQSGLPPALPRLHDEVGGHVHPAVPVDVQLGGRDGPEVDGAGEHPREQAHQARGLPFQHSGGRRVLRGPPRRRTPVAVPDAVRRADAAAIDA